MFIITIWRFVDDVLNKLPPAEIIVSKNVTKLLYCLCPILRYIALAKVLKVPTGNSSIALGLKNTFLPVNSYCTAPACHERQTPT